MVKNANNKLNRWSLEFATYNITLEWISGTQNKAADCLSWLTIVKDTLAIPTALIYMLVTSTQDGSATYTHSKTHNTADTTPPTDPTTTLTNDKVIIPLPLTEDQKDTHRLMQRMNPFCKCISKRLLSGKVPSYEETHSCTLKVSFTAMLLIQTKDFWH